jgi:hypothetical protein
MLINVLCKFHLQIFSLWAVSSRKYRGLGFTSQDVGIVLAISGMWCFFKLYIMFIVQERHSRKTKMNEKQKYICSMDQSITHRTGFGCCIIVFVWSCRYWYFRLSTCDLSIPCEICWVNQVIPFCSGMCPGGLPPKTGILFAPWNFLWSSATG